MCRPVQCNKCGKPGWVGCGMHVEKVLAHVPTDQRCRCAEHAQAAASPSKPPLRPR